MPVRSYRFLKKENPDREEIVRKFANRTDSELLGAIVNAEHSAAAIKILRQLAEERGIKEEDLLGWQMNEDSLYVAPFGEQPTIEQVLAGPAKRRRVHRIFQVFFAMGLIVTAIAFYQLKYTAWINNGVARGEVNPEWVEPFRSNIEIGDGYTYKYLHGRNEFVARIRSSFIEEAIRQSQTAQEMIAEFYIQGLDAEQIVLEFDQFENPDDVELVKGIKAAALVNQLEFVIGAEEPSLYMEVFREQLVVEIQLLDSDGYDDAAMFDFYSGIPEFESFGPQDGFWSIVLGSAWLVGILIWSFGSTFTWKSPARMLLLRPFQSKDLSKSLTKFYRKNLQYYGHTTTLADKHMKESKFLYWDAYIPKSPYHVVVILLLMIPWFRQLIRFLQVDSAKNYRLLKNRQSRRYTLNMFWVNAWNKILRVGCSDEWWKQAVDLLMYSSQAIIVDLSLVKEGTEWELDKINVRDLEKKTIFVVAEESEQYARDVIDKFWPSDEAPPPLFVYDAKGNIVEDEVSFHHALAKIISESHLWDENARAAYSANESSANENASESEFEKQD